MEFCSTYPGGKPGIGLLLLRAAVGVTAIAQGGVYLSEPGHSTVGMWIVGLLVIASGALLLIGFLTKSAGVVVGLSSIGVALSLAPVPALNLFDTKLSIIFVIVIAAAIILLGPGAFSLDSRLFGRREIIIPPASHPQ